MSNKLYVVGVGPGSAEGLTHEARQAIDAAGLVVAAPRHLPLADGHKNIIPLGKFDETFAAVEKALESGSVALLVSGDTGVFSLLPLVKRRFSAETIEVLPGISSLQVLCARARTTWIDAEILSGHGREIREAKILDAADQNKKTIFFCGADWTPGKLAATLRDGGLGNLKLTIGERLSYPDERLLVGLADELAGGDYDDLAVVLIENDSPWTKPQGRPRDADFIRTTVPMTRETVRSTILDELRLNKDSVVWDLGAGTGSVSVAAALFCEAGCVCAVEKNPNAVELIHQNCAAFHLHNLKIYHGDNAEVVKNLPRPTHVFIGGSGAELPELLSFILSLGAGVRVCVSAVAFKTYAAAAEILAGDGFQNFDAAQVAVSRAKKVGGTFIMAAQNAVTIFTAETRANTQSMHEESALKEIM